ncbi:MAG TPA: hypothetical protein VIF62_31065 [Labilithrix sp.]
MSARRSAIAVAVTLVACRQLVGIDSGPPVDLAHADGGPTVCGYAAPSADCGTCVQSHCCEEATTCTSNAACVTLAACERACEPVDDDCLAACELATPAGVVDERAFGECLAYECPACVSKAWACLEHAKPAPPAVQANIRITYLVADFVDGAPLTDITARVCDRADLECATPVGAPSTSDSFGRVVVTVPRIRFDGYVELSSATYGPVLVYAPPLVADYSAPVPLSSKTTFFQIGEAVGASGDRGSIIVAFRDCAGTIASGVALELTPSDGATAFYFQSGVPTMAATSTDAILGAGGFVGVAVGPGLSVHAKVAATGLAFPDRSVLARAGSAGGYTLVLEQASLP